MTRVRVSHHISLVLNMFSCVLEHFAHLDAIQYILMQLLMNCMAYNFLILFNYFIVVL
jgi:hypothetical protein